MEKFKFSIMVLSIFLLNLLIPAVVNAEDDFEVVSEDIKYYKTVVRENIFNTYSINSNYGYDIETVEVTKEEYDAFNPATAVQPSASSTVETTYKYMHTTLLSNGSYYRYKNYLSWKNMPATRSYDVIGIGFLSNVKLASSMTFTQEYCNANGVCYNTYSHNPWVGATGAATAFALPTGTLSRLNQTMYFDVTKNTSSTITSQHAYGDYSHAQSSVSLSNVFGFEVHGNAGISLPSSVKSSYDAISVTNAHWVGSW